MSDLTYIPEPLDSGKSLVWLHGAIRTPPFSAAARREAGILLRRLQRGEQLSLPHSRPMPDLGRRCHELRIPDARHTWRIIYRTDPDAVVILHVFAKKTQQMPQSVLQIVRSRLRAYDAAAGGTDG